MTFFVSMFRLSSEISASALYTSARISSFVFSVSSTIVLSESSTSLSASSTANLTKAFAFSLGSVSQVMLTCKSVLPKLAILPPLVHRLHLGFLAEQPHIFIGFVCILNADNRVHMVDAMCRVKDTHLCRCDHHRCLPAYLEGQRDIPKLLTEGEGTRRAADPRLRVVANLRTTGVNRLPTIALRAIAIGDRRILLDLDAPVQLGTGDTSLGGWDHLMLLSICLHG